MQNVLLKPNFRVLAIDDGSFRPGQKQKIPLVGVIYRIDGRIEGILSQKISVDALDSTEKIIEMLSDGKFLQQVSFILLQGINFAGFNIADVKRLNSVLKKPIIIVFRKFPDMDEIRNALRKFPDREKRLALIRNAGKIRKINSIHFQFIGTDEPTAREVIKKTLMHSFLPEPIRIAHLVASGMTLGQSTRP
ncbi:MAG: DUF99 family protein [Candidatus Diapherotrites archaeon]|uniref:UPF0215 protein J4415_03865 n=1 Tax=Candidatus Iainarchaeum sp. TaxID=3101447 RepID=A0A8T4L1R4_9ARCH|nr:DUF99 family protein [Candidatus Diapherotrites archaeon]